MFKNLEDYNDEDWDMGNPIILEKLNMVLDLSPENVTAICMNREHDLIVIEEQELDKEDYLQITEIIGDIIEADMDRLVSNSVEDIEKEEILIPGECYLAWR